MRRTIITAITLLTTLLLVSVSIGTSQAKGLKLQHGDTTVTSIRFTPDGAKFASASFNGTVVMWNAISGERVWYFDLDEKSRTKDRYTISHIFDMDISSEGSTLAISYSQSSVIGETLQAGAVERIALIDAKNGQVTKTLAGRGVLAFSPRDESLLWLSNDQIAQLWNVKTEQNIQQIKLKAGADSLVFSPDGKQFVIAIGPGWDTHPESIVGLYDSETGKLLREFPRQYSQVTGIAFSRDGKYLLIGGFNTPCVTTKLWNLSLPNSQESETILAGEKGLVGNYAYSPDGKLLAYGECQRGRQMVSIMELSANKKVRSYKLNAEAKSLAFSPDGTHLAIGTTEGQITLATL